MSISSVGQQGPVTSINNNSQVQGQQQQQAQAKTNNLTNSTAQQTGAQPLNATGRGQVVNLVV